MNMKALSLVIGAALGASAMQASADALLAPYFKQGPGIITTNYLMVTRGEGYVNSQWDSEHSIHTYYFTKSDVGPDIPQWGFSRQTTPCIRDDTYGKFSSWDYVVADVATGTLYPTQDKTEAPLFGLTNVEGFIIFQEETADGGQQVGVEGDFSGFVYIFSISAASAIDYKMLNNPTNQDGNDWSNTVISKNVFDVSWWPIGAVDTLWPTIVVGNNMLSTPNGSWGGAVSLTGYDWKNQTTGQVYNNDERLFSSQGKKDIVCAGQVTRNELMTPLAELNTRNGGWGRYIATAKNDNFCDPAQSSACTSAGPKNATGALMQKWEYFLPRGPLAWTIETSGSTTGNPGWGSGSVVNAPY